jgi:tetratricopeptide (TPR) repeat protein/predicted Ser/Thr protein kinase
MKLNLDPGFDGDLDRAVGAIERGWITIEEVERAIESVDRSPGTRLLNHLPLTPQQLQELETPRPAPLPPEVAAFSQDPARRVDHYILVEHLGTGGMGVVHKAWDLKLSRWVALKFLKTVGDEGGKAYFEREARLAAGLSHPNIAAIYEVGLRDEGPFIAMQYVPGQRLENFPRKNLKRLVSLIRDAARAVAFANNRGVIHRDLKPSNLMVTPEGHLYVMDFGVARPVEGPGRASISGSSGSVVGTPEYMAPEQARGEEVDARSDVYSLGATLYEVLTGRAPFRGSNVYEVLRRVEEEEPRRLRKVNPRIPPDLETIVLKCLEKDPARRYETAEALADDLQRYLEGEPIQARPTSPIYRLGKKLAKRKPLVAVAAAALVAVVGLSLFLVPRWRGADLAAEAERTKTETRRRAQTHIDLARLGIQRMEQFLSEDKDRNADLEREGRRAQEELEKALAICPDHEEAWFELGQLEGLLGHGRRALDPFSKAIEASPGMAKAYLERAMLNLEVYEEHRHRSGGKVKPETEASSKLLAIVKADLAKVREWSKDLPHLKHAEAMLLFADGEWGEAAERWREYLDHSPGDARAWEWRGHALIHANRAEDAVAALDRAVHFRPRTCNAHQLLGLARLNLKDFHRAITACDKAIELKPTTVVAYVNRGTARLVLKDYEGAIQDCTKAIELDPQVATAYLHRGVARRNLKDYEGAIQDFTKATELDPKHTGAYSNRGLAREALRDFRGAIEDFTKAIELDPQIAEAYLHRGVARRNLKDYEGAIEDFTKAIELDSKNAYAYHSRALAREALRDFRGAITDYDAAIQLDPQNSAAYYGRGIARYELKDFRGAITDYDTAIQLDPQFVWAYSNRGNARANLKDYEGAIRDCTKAIELDPQYTKAYFNRGLARHCFKDYEGAIRDCTKAIELDPQYTKAYYNRGNARGKLKDFEGALRDFAKVIELDPKDAMAYSNLGLTRAYLKDHEAAIRDCTKAIELDSKNANTYRNRALAWEALKDYEAAIRDFAKVIDLLPQGDEWRADAAYWIACLYARRRDSSQALDWLEKAVEMGWKDVAHLEKDPDLESLRGEKRYRQLVEKMKEK